MKTAIYRSKNGKTELDCIVWGTYGFQSRINQLKTLGLEVTTITTRYC